jgi:hypothetical protein
MKSANQLRLTPPSDYRGFDDILVKLLDKEVNALNRKATFEQQLVHDPNLRPFLKYFSQTKPEFSWRHKKNIPNICLIKNTRFIENQKNLARGINKCYPSIATVVYNGSGCMVYYRGMSTLTIADKKVKVDEFSDVTIADTLQYFYDNGGVKKFPRIIIISGDLAGRGISYVTRNYKWHTTDMYYIPAASTPVHEMIQSAGRLCGRNRTMSHLHLHCTMKVAMALYDGFHFMDEVIARAITQPLIDANEEASFADSIKSVRMNKRKMPTGRELAGKVKLHKSDFNLTRRVSDKDGGRDVSSYKYKTVEEYEKEVEEFLIENHPDEFGPKTEKKQEIKKELPKEEFTRLTQVMFPKWSKADTKIARFMQNLDPNKKYTEDEMKEYCQEQGITKIIQVMNRKAENGTCNYYGIIMKQFRNTYQLYPELNKEFLNYF